MLKWITVIYFIFTYTQCAKFGDDNSYTCHCINDEQCDKVSGKCSGDCAKGWYGTSCQKQNVALGKTTSQVDTIGNRTSDLAVDGDRTTNIPDKCSDTSKGDGTTRWWGVDLKDEYPIKNIAIYYRSEPSWVLPSLIGFSIHVSKENQAPELCYKDNSNSLPAVNAVNDITCNQLTGRYVNISNYKIRLDARFLTFCEVEVYVCSVGTYGSECTNFCHCLNNKRCSETGQCPEGCADGWTGPTCNEKTCPKGFYGEGCHVNCGNRKCSNKNSSCDYVRGECIGGCSDGYILTDCSKACDGDTYGTGCVKLCSDRNCLVETSSCNHINGSCQGGCKDGFSGSDCAKACDNGNYGAGCIKLCSDRNCLVETSSCNHINGSCQGGCKEGFSGIDCLRCKDGVYGAGCSKKCSDRKCKDSNLQCDSKTGECIDGCQPGYQSIDCTQECDSGTYGQNCQFYCSSRFCQSQDNCSKIDGDCDCLDGYQGTDCIVKQAIVSPGGVNPGPSDDQETIIIAAVVSGCVVLIIIVVIVVLIIRRRRTPPLVDDEKSDKARNIAVVKPQVQGPIYENSDVIREESIARVAVEPTRNVYKEETPSEAQQLPEAAQESEDAPVVESDATSEEVEISPYTMPEKSDMNLAELEEFVKKTKPNAGFDMLYKGLPDDFTSSYDISHLPENRKKNRFKGYYPYDATRVVLDKLADDPHSDYINANFLKGYDGKNFIASQGATRVNQNDFVRMIWDMKCDKVVMVTREFEGGKRKCERYWPEAGSETFGVVKLTLKNEIYRENYTKRQIIMERDGMTHTFYHFHYISWPDHGVPEINDMLDFQFTVNKFKPESTSPVLVHCSAGVGRTGTYIAIDYCLKQYNDIGKVEILECVKSLRQQRKGMVQTPSQLQFIHEALIEGIKRGDTAMYQNIFESEYHKHASKIRIGNMPLTQQFSYLKTVVNNEEETANNKHIVNGRTQLYRFSSHTLEFGIYFEELRNVEPNDVWKGIFQNDSKVAVFILDNTNTVAVCPDVGSEETRGEFVIENKSDENMSPTLNAACLSLKTQGQPELEVNALISSVDKSTVKNTRVLYKHILDVIEKMEIYQNDLQPFIIFTSDSQYSRIFCILHNIVQRIRLDNEVEIFKTVRKMHRQIGKAIKSQEEYNTLHAVVAEYVKSRNTYANL